MLIMEESSNLEPCPEKATELRRGDSGFFSAGTTPLTPYKELNGLAQTGVIAEEEGLKMTSKLPLARHHSSSEIYSMEDDLLLAFCCRQERETQWGNCSHAHCQSTRMQLEHFKSCKPANSTTQSCAKCTNFQKSVLSHAMRCTNTNGGCPIPMCSDAKRKLEQYSNSTTRSSSSSDLVCYPPPTPRQRVGSVGSSSFMRQGSTTSRPSYIAARNALTAAGIGSLPSNLVLDLKTKAEEIVSKLEQEEPLEEDFHTPESSIHSHPSTFHSAPSGISIASGVSAQGEAQYLPPLALQGKLSPIAELPSPASETSFQGSGVSSPAHVVQGGVDVPVGGRKFPLQTILHYFDTPYLTPGEDDFYYQNRDYMVNDVAPLGEGGFGTCVFGQNRSNESVFAMKRNNRDDEDKIDSIRSECRMLARIRSHDNVIRFLGAVVDEEDGGYPPCVCKMFMELAENGNLYEMLEDEEGNRSPLPPDQSLYYLQQILQAVHYLHLNFILHGDIKSLNVLVFNNGRVVKLADFGNAVHVEEIATVGIAKLKGCTPFFAAPEVIRQHQPTFSADIWSTMCVFVEMLTAKMPGCYRFQRDQANMMFLVGNYTDDQIEELVPLSKLQLESDVADLFHMVFKRDHKQRPTALQLLNLSCIIEACEYEKFFDYEEEEEEEVGEYLQDEQPQPQLQSEEDSFQTAPSSLPYIPIEIHPKPAKRGSSVDSGAGDSIQGGRNSIGSLTRDRGYDSGIETPGSVDCRWNSRFTFRTQAQCSIMEKEEEECLERSYSFPESSLNIIALRRHRSNSLHHNGTDDFHSLPATIDERLSNGMYQMNLVDPTHPAAMHKRRPSSIQPLIHSNSDPVMPDASRSIPHRKLSLGINGDAETNGVRKRPTLRRNSSEVYVDKGPEIDTPEDKKQSDLDLHASTSLSLSSSSSSSSSSSHQHSSEWSQNSSLSSQASTICERARSGSAPAAPSPCVTTYGGPQSLSEGEGERFPYTTSGFSPAAPTELESTVQGPRKICEDHSKKIFQHII